MISIDSIDGLQGPPKGSGSSQQLFDLRKRHPQQRGLTASRQISASWLDPEMTSKICQTRGDNESRKTIEWSARACED